MNEYPSVSQHIFKDSKQEKKIPNFTEKKGKTNKETSTNEMKNRLETEIIIR